MSYVVKGTPKNYDVTTAADYLLNFSSSWPLLKLHETGNFSGTISHGLGYPAFYLLARPAGGSGTADGRIDQLASNYAMTSSMLSRNSGSGSPRYFIFRTDLTTNYTAPTVSSSTASSASPDGYVFRMTKPDKDTDSTDMRDFALHSNTRSLMLHKVDEEQMSVAASGWERTVAHGLSYIPEVFVFIKVGTNPNGYDPNGYLIVPPPIGASLFSYTVDSTNVYVTADGSFNQAVPRASVVVLKDPLTKEIINVSFP